jgi:hypothetical protein
MPEFAMSCELVEIRLSGRDKLVPSFSLGASRIIVDGRAFRSASIFDEDLAERATLPDPEHVISQLKSGPLRADIYTFSQRPPDIVARYPYRFEVDNWAVVSTASAVHWWENLPQESRKNARIAAKRGVTVQTVQFNDELVRGIKHIYDETPVRQGRKFWHYGKSLESVKKENSTYLDRSTFIGAYLNDELIGFIKYVKTDEQAILMQIIAKVAHRDKRPMNALLKHTIEECERNGLSMLRYGNFNYGVNPESSLTEFKRRNGFQELSFPRYTVPLTILGRTVVGLGLHQGVRALISTPVRARLVSTRARLMAFWAKRGVGKPADKAQAAK